MRFRRLIEDYLNPEIKDLQRDLMDLGRAQIFSPPCFSFLLLLSASSVAPREAFSQSTVGENKARKESRIWWRRWTGTRVAEGVAALWKKASTGEGWR